MSRLHFDLLQAVLDADISAAATTITFTAPLKEWGEDLIPTVASPDIVAIRVGYELMHITAYTSGESTATVLRGQEGSTATTHNEGDAVRAVPTAADFLAISPVDSVNGQTGTVVLGAADVGAVATTGAETIAGVKTFSSDPIVPAEVYGVGWNGSNEVPTKNDLYDKIETISAGGSGTFVSRVYQSLTNKSTWGAVDTREQWGTEEATVDDATLPSLTDVTVYASVRGEINSWTSNSLFKYRVEISLDGGSTWSQGADIWLREDVLTSTDRIGLFQDHQVSGTVTGDIQARVMAETDGITPAMVLNAGRIAMEVLV